MKKPELLAPAGNLSKLKTAFYYGADAAYIGGKSFSLRSFCDNFTKEELKEAVEYAHNLGKKVYVTVNIFAKNSDFDEANEFFFYLNEIKVDAVIISDPGLIMLAKGVAPDLELHLSTQANTTNKYSALFWGTLGIKRVILARELSIAELTEIRAFLPKEVEIECFVHGAMCISYSGRCLLSDYFTSRQSNRGECVQACRWNYQVREKSRDGDFYDVEEDNRGTYIFNSKDLNMISNLDLLANAGVDSFKIEGRMKSEYYLATVINAYRKAIDSMMEVGSKYKENPLFLDELLKTGHRAFTTAYALGENHKTVNYDDAQSLGNRVFTAAVTGFDKTTMTCEIEMRNRFLSTDSLEILTPNDYLNQVIVPSDLRVSNNNLVSDAKIVQQKLYFTSPIVLNVGDILRK